MQAAVLRGRRSFLGVQTLLLHGPVLTRKIRRMSNTPPTLHMFCGKIASGKSTLAARLADADRTVLIAEDDWLHALFADELKTGQDYLRLSRRLKAVMGDHVSSLLEAGISVGLDFPANTVDARDWVRGILARTGAAHRLHVFDVPDEVCLARLAARNESGAHAFQVSEALFRQFTRHYVSPAQEEGFTLVVHSSDA